MKLKSDVDAKELHRRSCVRRRIRKHFDLEDPRARSRVKQADRDRADINQIVRRFVPDENLRPVAHIGALLQAVSPGKALMEGDVSNAPDYQAMYNAVAEGRQAFLELPSDIRKRFGNDPQQLLNFISDNANYDEAVKLGLLDKVKVDKRSSDRAAAAAAAAIAATAASDVKK